MEEINLQELYEEYLGYNIIFIVRDRTIRDIWSHLGDIEYGDVELGDECHECGTYVDNYTQVRQEFSCEFGDLNYALSMYERIGDKMLDHIYDKEGFEFFVENFAVDVLTAKEAKVYHQLKKYISDPQVNRKGLLDLIKHDVELFKTIISDEKD